MESKEISQAVIRRLPRYYRYLGDLLDQGVVRISSRELSVRMHVTASQIRQDLNHFGGFGQQGYGYNVQYLHDEIGKIIGLDRVYHVIIIGAGNLGQAIAGYHDFEKRGFRVSAMFDKNPEKVGLTVRGITVDSIDNLEAYLNHHKVDIAALTVPKSEAPGMALQLSQWGVRAIWNFAPVDLNVPENVIVENVHLSDTLMQLSYQLKDR